MSTEAGVLESYGCRIQMFTRPPFGAEARCLYCSWRSLRYGEDIKVVAESHAMRAAYEHEAECPERPAPID